MIEMWMVDTCKLESILSWKGDEFHEEDRIIMKKSEYSYVVNCSGLKDEVDSTVAKKQCSK